MKKYKFLVFAMSLILLEALLVRIAIPQDVTEEYKFYFGNFHAHYYAPNGGDDGGYSWKTTRKKYRNPENTAEKAFATAMKNGCDFYGITPHSHIISQEEYEKLIKTAEEFNRKNKEKFVALYGQEWGELTQGNHVLLMGGRTLCQDIPASRFDLLYEKWLPAHPDVVFLQFNHPHIGRSEIDFGFDDYGSVNELASKSGAFARSMAIIPGLKQSSRGYKRHAETITLYFYMDFLNRGWYIAPTADEDNHRDDWGAMIAARTVVLAKELTPEAIYEAARNRRMYATEDDEMMVTFKVRGDFGEKWMGSIIPINGDTKVTFIARVDQKAGTDKDPIEEGNYDLELFGDLDGRNGEKAKVIEKIKVKRGQDANFTVTAKPYDYFFLHVKETKGKDNGGRNDDAYTSPIWFGRK